MSAGAEQFGAFAVSDALVGETPWECPVCLAAAGALCAYHEVWAAGWDACAAMVAQVAANERHGTAAGSGCSLCGGHGVIPCGTCDGQAETFVDEECWACDGTGDEPCPECDPESGGAE